MNNDLEETIVSFLQSGAEFIRDFDDTEELVDLMQSVIDDGRACVVLPSNKTMRRLFHFPMFERIMREVESRLQRANVLVEPISLDAQALFAVGPAYQQELEFGSNEVDQE